MRVGPYTLHGTIAAGGFGQVDYATIEGEGGFSRLVAVKRVRADRLGSDEALAMLADEARLVSRIRHPNVVGVLDVLRTDAELFVVMEYVDGETLAFFLRLAREQSQRVALPIVSAIISGVLEGLHAAHEALDEAGAPLGIVHRDVSPTNIMVGTDGHARLLDFGVAKAHGRLQSTIKGEIKGKLSYMAPEQLALEPVTRRADLYAVSVVLWELLTLERLFDGPDAEAIIERVLVSLVDPPSKYAPDLPEDLERLVLRSLSRDPAERFATAREMAAALVACVTPATAGEVSAWVESGAAESLEKRRPVVGPRAMMPTLPDMEPQDFTVVGAPPEIVEQRRRFIGGALALSVLALMTLAAVVVLRTRTPAADMDDPLEDAGAVVSMPALDASTAAPVVSPTPTPTPPPPPPSSAAQPLASPADAADTTTAEPDAGAATRSRRWHPRKSKPPPGCDIPFNVDRNGQRIYKRECLGLP